jgi:hypothetical protein
MDERVKEERIAQARAEIAKRIRSVCDGLAPADLEKLLDRMALIQWKYEILPNVPELPESERVSGQTSGECS